MTKELKDIDILEILPQRRPFIMVDHLIYSDGKVAVTDFEVKVDCLFCEDGRLQASGLLENIAQTCAARIGYQTLLRNGKVMIGVIGAVRNMQISDLPWVGEQLITRIEILEEVFQMTLINAVIKVGENVVAECQMKIALTNM